MGLAETVLLIVVLLLVGLALIIVEICTPTFGVLALLAIGCVAGAVYLCYRVNSALGLFATVAAVLLLPTYAIVAAKVIPKTALGRRLGLRRERAERGEGTPEADDLGRFVGRTTVAESILRPSGVIRVDGRRVIAQAESGLIAKGQAVKIIRAAGTHVVVRKVES
jgi:membrane-bound serine protease (ClpP class)